MLSRHTRNNCNLTSFGRFFNLIRKSGEAWSGTKDLSLFPRNAGSDSHASKHFDRQMTRRVIHAK
jgi:hypothetical protein